MHDAAGCFKARDTGHAAEPWASGFAMPIQAGGSRFPCLRRKPGGRVAFSPIRRFVQDARHTPLETASGLATQAAFGLTLAIAPAQSPSPGQTSPLPAAEPGFLPQ